MPIRRRAAPRPNGATHAAPVPAGVPAGPFDRIFTRCLPGRLLDEPSLDLRAVFGTSAWAMNAGVLAIGLAGSGCAGAQPPLQVASP